MESSADSFADIPASVLSRLNLTHEKSCSSGNETESCRSSLSGTTLKRLAADLGEERLMLSAGDSLAQTLVPPGATTTKTERLRGLADSIRASGESSAESLQKSNLHLCLSKTPRHCGLADLALSCESLPRWGMMHDGECWEFASLARIISETGFGSLLPTPTCHNAKEGAYPAEFTRRTPTLGAQIGGKINPEWNEWRMGWPVGWTDLKPSETGKFRQWLDSHGMP